MDISGLEWVLVIEKEVCMLLGLYNVARTLRRGKATFRSLAESAFWRTSKAGKGLILTVSVYSIPV